MATTGHLPHHTHRAPIDLIALNTTTANSKTASAWTSLKAAATPGGTRDMSPSSPRPGVLHPAALRPKVRVPPRPSTAWPVCLRMVDDGERRELVCAPSGQSAAAAGTQLRGARCGHAGATSLIRALSSGPQTASRLDTRGPWLPCRLGPVPLVLLWNGRPISAVHRFPLGEQLPAILGRRSQRFPITG
jgi:hypothetical protein